MTAVINPSCEEAYAWNYAMNGDINKLNEKIPSSQPNKQWFVDMAIMGSCETKNIEAYNWAWKNGANIILTITNLDVEKYERQKDTNNRLKMLGGPGEVKKGTFGGAKNQ